MSKNIENEATKHEFRDAAFHSPISALDIPDHINALLKKNGFHNVGQLIQQMETEKEELLDISGIGPKILEQIDLAVADFAQDTEPVSLPHHPPPVSTLADFYHPPIGEHHPEQAKNSDDEIKSEASFSYHSPVPSLSDYFDPENMVAVVESLPMDETQNAQNMQNGSSTKVKKKSVIDKKSKSKKTKKSKVDKKKKPSKRKKSGKNKKKVTKKKKKKSNKKKSKKGKNEK